MKSVRALLVPAFLGLGLIVGAPPADAASLASQIDTLFGENGIELDVRPANPEFPPHTAHFSSDSLATLGLLARQLAAGAADFPAISTVPGVTYRWDPNLEVFERQTGNLGPVFVERAKTIGAGRIAFGTSLTYAGYDELNGEDLDGIEFRGLRHNDCCADPPSLNAPPFEGDTADLKFERFDLQAHVVSFFLTYGITDWIDLNVLVPVVHTQLNLRATAEVGNQSGADVHFFDVEELRTTETRRIDDESTGIGDLQVRSKFRLLDGGPVDVSSGLALRVATGDEDDFQGVGDTTLTPSLFVGRQLGIVDTHASTGVEWNFEDSDRSRFRYGFGASVQVVDKLALLVDFLGSSNIRTDRVGVQIPTFEGSSTQTGFERVTRDVSTDVIDLSTGIKVELPGRAIGFAAVFIPLNEDGLRAGAIPAGGVEISF